MASAAPYATIGIETSEITLNELSGPHRTKAMDDRSLLSELPSELKIYMLSFLNAVSLLNISQLNREWHELITHTAALQYTIELFSDGLISLPSAMPHSERLQLLLKRRQNWRYMDWTVSHLPNIDTACIAYELTGRVFVKLIDSQLHIVRMLQDPVLEKFPCSARDVALDPAQDLIILLDHSLGNSRLSLQIRTLTSLSAHPKAADEIIRYDNPPNELTEILMQISNDVVVLFGASPPAFGRPRAIAFNWQSGTLMFDVELQLPNPTIQFGWDFGLLSRQSFVWCTDPGQLMLFSFHDNYPKAVARLLLPPTNSHVDLHSMRIHSSPLVCHDPEYYPECSTQWEKPFAVDPTKRIHVLQMRWHPVDFHDPIQPFRMIMVIRSDAFEKYLDCQSTTCAEVPWNEWGPRYTHIIAASGHGIFPSFPWLTYTHGTRLVLRAHSLGTGRPQGTQSITVLDFSPGASRGEIPSSPSSVPHQGDLEVHDVNPIVVSNADYFTDDILSELPCYGVSRPVDFSPDMVAVDEDCLIAFTDSSQPDVPGTVGKGLYLYKF